MSHLRLEISKLLLIPYNVPFEIVRLLFELFFDIIKIFQVLILDHSPVTNVSVFACSKHREEYHRNNNKIDIKAKNIPP